MIQYMHINTYKPAGIQNQGQKSLDHFNIQKVFEKIQHMLIVNTLKKLRIEET
jgi:hypothetical protein